jgi:hypothetical protein
VAAVPPVARKLALEHPLYRKAELIELIDAISFAPFLSHTSPNPG